MTERDASDDRRLETEVAGAVDFRGDVTVHLRDGTCIEGFVFDARLEPAERACIRLLPTRGGPRAVIPLASIERVEQTGKDAATGRSWEQWLRRYAEKKLAGEPVSIESEPLA